MAREMLEVVLEGMGSVDVVPLTIVVRGVVSAGRLVRVRVVPWPEKKLVMVNNVTLELLVGAVTYVDESDPPVYAGAPAGVLWNEETDRMTVVGTNGMLVVTVKPGATPFEDSTGAVAAVTGADPGGTPVSALWVEVEVEVEPPTVNVTVVGGRVMVDTFMMIPSPEAVAPAVKREVGVMVRVMTSPIVAVSCVVRVVVVELSLP